MEVLDPQDRAALSELNQLEEITSPSNSVPIMRMIKVHRPASERELEMLIAQHAQRHRPCGITSTGTIEDFGKRLYDAQIKHWGAARYPLRVCSAWQRELMVRHSLKGARMEIRAAQLLRRELGRDFFVAPADDHLDLAHGVDLEVLLVDRRIAGVQVKPHAAARFETRSPRRDDDFLRIPVYTLYYTPQERFLELGGLAKRIRAAQ